MNDNVKFEDFRLEVFAKLDEKAGAFLEEAKDSIASQASRNSPVDTGALKASFQTDSFVDEQEKTAYVGSSLEYAIWQEFGTGEYALNGNGRKGGWAYKDPKTGKTIFTHGNRPMRMLYHAFEQKKEKVKNRAKKIFGEI
ncbi:MAG: HK97 gp10 family phage protein [Erysipelotrichia bacterium]|nr:HK97 gp10 family phage protein [Erysipelotrichia bacterium]